MNILSRLPREKLNALEKISIENSSIKPNGVLKIINAYENHLVDGRASRAARYLPFSQTTVLKYWRRAGFEIKKGGRETNKEEYAEIRKLIKRGLNKGQIGKKLKISTQGVIHYLDRHLELEALYESKRKK